MHKIILDKAYCNIIIIRYLNLLQIPYEIMLDKDTFALQELIKKFGDAIKINCGNYWIKDTDLFGIKIFTQIFKKEQYSDNVNLFFNPLRYGIKVNKFLNKLFNEFNTLKWKLKNGEDINVSKCFKEIIEITDDNNKKDVVYNIEALTTKLSSYGFFGIINHINDETSYKTICLFLTL